MKRLVGILMLLPLSMLGACATAQRQLTVEVYVTFEGEPLEGATVRIQDLRKGLSLSLMPRPVALTEGRTDHRGRFDSGTLMVEGTIDITVEHVHCVQLGGSRQLTPEEQHSDVTFHFDVERHDCDRP